MSLGVLITILSGVIGITLSYSVLLEMALGYRKERRDRRDRRLIESRHGERRQSPFPWNGIEQRSVERRNVQRRVLDRRSVQEAKAA